MSARPITAFVWAILVAAPALAQTPPAAKSDAPGASAAPAATPAPAPAPAATPAPAKAAGEHAMEGLAAYYSSRLNGHKTASGQTFNQDALTAAHPTLPFGTRVKVTNTKNGKSVVVRINDRGPTQAGRVVDLSRAAANRIGIGRGGLAPVKLEVVAEAPAKKSRAAATKA